MRKEKKGDVKKGGKPKGKAKQGQQEKSSSEKKVGPTERIGLQVDKEYANSHFFVFNDVHKMYNIEEEADCGDNSKGTAMITLGSCPLDCSHY